MAEAAEEHFNLAWNQFESCAASTFKNLLADQDFADVTLACDGDKQVTAHKVILSACSPFFRNILKKNRHQHPLLYLKGVKYRHLELIVKFIYLGQIEIDRDCLSEFLVTAKELEVKGLMEANDTTAKEEDDDVDTMGALEPETEIMESGEEEDQERDGAVVVQGHDWGEEEYSYSGHGGISEDGNSLPGINENFTQSDFKQKFPFYSTPTKTADGKYQCVECTYRATSAGNLKRHALAKHSGERVPCPLCGKDFASKDGLKVHVQNKHEGVMFRCKLCDHEATTKSNLLRHMHKKHEPSALPKIVEQNSGSGIVEVEPSFSTEPEPEPANFYVEYNNSSN